MHNRLVAVMKIILFHKRCYDYFFLSTKTVYSVRPIIFLPGQFPYNVTDVVIMPQPELLGENRSNSGNVYFRHPRPAHRLKIDIAPLPARIYYSNINFVVLVYCLPSSVCFRYSVLERCHQELGG